MTTKELEHKAHELRELKRLSEELTAEISSIEDEIKAHMTEIKADMLTAGEYKISWKTISSSRIDTAALKRVLPEIAQQFSKTTTTRRFCVQ